MFCFLREHAFSLLQNCWERSAHGHSHMQLQYTTQVIKLITANVTCTAALTRLVFALQVTHSAFLSSVSVFVLFYEKERNLGANVRHEDTAHSHMVSCLSHLEVFFFSNLVARLIKNSIH